MTVSFDLITVVLAIIAAVLFGAGKAYLSVKGEKEREEAARQLREEEAHRIATRETEGFINEQRTSLSDHGGFSNWFESLRTRSKRPKGR